MDQADVALMDRAYARRIELLGQPGVQWVDMALRHDGVLLTVQEEGGQQVSEWIEAGTPPADGGSGNGAYDRE